MKIIEVGCIPPPFGGVAVHLERLIARLAQHGLPHLLFDIGGTPKQIENVVCTTWGRVILRLLGAPRSIVHFHNFSPQNLLYFRLLGLRHLTILSLHNERFMEELNTMPAPYRKLSAGSFNMLEAIVVPNDDCRNLLAPLVSDREKIQVCPAFIPPHLPALRVLPETVAEFRRRHRFMIASSAFTIRFHHGEDLYGIDLLVELTANLRLEHKLDVGTVFLLPSVGDDHYFRDLRARIAERGLEGSFLFVTKPLAEACFLWQAADLVIRATNTDGNSLMVQEALWCKTPVLAGDCVPRGPGVVLFRTRDPDDLADKAKMILGALPEYRSAAKEIECADNAEKLIEIYHSLQEQEARCRHARKD